MQVVVHTDGGSRGNPGKSAIGVVIESDGTPLLQKGLYIGIGTNNRAEYLAVVEALNWLSSHPQDITKASFFLDSQLVVSQLQGVYAVKHPDMIELKRKVDSLRGSLPFPVEFSYVPRAQNAQADALVNQALDAQR
jgi:ribonuclease HI